MPRPREQQCQHEVCQKALIKTKKGFLFMKPILSLRVSTKSTPIEHLGCFLYTTMSHQQVFDSVDTPLTNEQKWPSFSDFNYPYNVLKWCDAQTGILKILHRLEHGESQYGKGLILKLEPLCGHIFFVYAPDSLIFALKLHEDTKFIQNFALRVDFKGNQYFDFKLC